MDKTTEYEENMQLEKIDITVMLNDYIQLLLKRWKLIILFMIIGSGIVTLIQQITYKPVYTASSTYAIYLNDENKNNYYNNTTAQQMAKSFPYILTSGVLQRKVAKSMGENTITGNISSAVTENTNFLVLSVSDSNPQSAYHTLQAVIQNYPEVSERIIGKVKMELLDETGIPDQPDNPKSMKKSIFWGGISGLGISFVYLLIFLITRKTIRREEDCKKKVNKKCLGDIPKIEIKERSHQKEFHPTIFQKNIDQHFIESFQLLSRKVIHEMDKNKAKSILVTSTSPGEGKSTVAVNLALSLAKSGKKVTLVDCDLRNPSDAEIFGEPKEVGIVDFLSDKVKLSECMIEGKDILSENIPFLLINGGKAVEDGVPFLSNHKIQDLIKILEEKMDYVIVDTPPVGLITDASIVASYVDGAVFVVKKDYATTTHILEAMEHLADSNIKLYGCILNGK